MTVLEYAALCGSFAQQGYVDTQWDEFIAFFGSVQESMQGVAPPPELQEVHRVLLDYLRITIGYAAQQDPDGWVRWYGALDTAEGFAANKIAEVAALESLDSEVRRTLREHYCYY